MKVSVLTYHSNNITGNEYHTNDLVALSQDLKLLNELDITIISSHSLIKWMKSEIELDDSKRYIVLTFDDGTELDLWDWQHPYQGFQKSAYTIMNEFHKSTGRSIHATSFVIASPRARNILEQTCLAGHKIWGDSWWQEAQDTQLISIENHSWDHLHHTIEQVSQKDNIRGNFRVVDTVEDAYNQVSKASKYIESKINDKKVTLFAYPYGHYNSFLTDEFFPKLQKDIVAAFTCDPEHVTKSTNIWEIPRFVCGHNWKSVEELKAIIL